MTQAQISRTLVGNRYLTYPRLHAAALLPGAAFLLIMLWLSASTSSGELRFTLFDDAMISMTYAKTLAETGEWVWVPDAPRVQGITNPLWTLILTVVHLVGLEGSTAALLVSSLGIALVLGTGFLVALTVRTLLASHPSKETVSAIAGATVPFLFPLAFWSIRGMEVGLLALTATAMGLALALQHDGQATRTWLPLASASALVGLATRLDFAVIGGTCLILMVLLAQNKRQRVLAVVWLAIPLVALAVLILTFQYLYWGEWLPNTYTLKVEGFSLADRGLRGILASANILPMVALVATSLSLTCLSNRNTGQRRVVAALALLFLVGTGYSVWTGGDAWEWSQMANRYESIVLPLAVAVIFVSAPWITSRSAESLTRVGLSGLLGITALSVGFGLLTNVSSNLADFHWRFAALALIIASGSALIVFLTARATIIRGGGNRRFTAFLLSISLLTAATVGGVPMAMWWSSGGPLTREDAELTRWSRGISEVTSPDAIVATVQAGAPGYYTKRSMIDLLGKSDRTVARSEPVLVPGNNHFYPGHNKWDYEYSIGKLRPDVVSELWFGTQEDEIFLIEGGYAWQCFGNGHAAYFLESSPNVKWSLLSECPANSP